MKKAMKLVWMVLFALPMISLTACGDDDDPVDVGGVEVSFKDYSDLLGKSRDKVQEIMNIKISDTDEDGSLYYDGNLYQENEINENHIGYLDVYFTFFQENEYDTNILYDKAVQVNVAVTGYTKAQLFTYLAKKYEAVSENEYRYTFKKGNDMYIWYEWLTEDDEYNDFGIPYAEITYVDKKEFDKAFPDTKSLDANIDAWVKARRAHRAK